MIENAPGQVAHDVVPQHAARLRRASHDQIVTLLARFGENLIDHDSMANPDLRRDTEFFQIRSLLAQVDPKLGIRFEQSFDILFQPHQVGVNRRRLSHDVKQGDGGANGFGKFTGQLDRFFDEFFAAGANQEAF